MTDDPNLDTPDDHDEGEPGVEKPERLAEWLERQRARRDAGELPTEPLEELETLDEPGRAKNI